MHLPNQWYEDEVRDGFYVPAIMKRNWAAQMEVMERFDEVCKQLNIPWFMGFGTLLGAVRHKGFIPWDDDIDLYMSRDDLTLFLKQARPLFPKGYEFLNPVERGNTALCYGVVNWSENGMLPREMWKDYHGYPFQSHIELFALESIAEDPVEEEFRERLAFLTQGMMNLLDKREKRDKGELEDNELHSEYIGEPLDELLEECLSETEAFFHVQFDRTGNLRKQVSNYFERLCMYPSFSDSQVTDRVAIMAFYANEQKSSYSRKCFEDTVYLPFEGMSLPAPAGYDEVLTEDFGDYMTIVKSFATHNYPNFDGCEVEVAEKLKERWPYTYTVPQANDARLKIDQARSDRNGPFDRVAAMLQSLKKAQSMLRAALTGADSETVAKLLQICQDTAASIGNTIEENSQDGSAGIIALLESYCDSLYSLFMLLTQE